MQTITKKEFFRLLINRESAKLAAPDYPGSIELTDEFVKKIFDKTPDLRWRKVVHTQSNAIKFEDDSWLWFDKARNCDSRKAYRFDIDGNAIIILVDHRPEYENQFGTRIAEKTFILAYLLKQ